MDFRDFVLGRMSKVKLPNTKERGPSDVAGDVGHAWSSLTPGLARRSRWLSETNTSKGPPLALKAAGPALLNYLIRELMAATDVDRQTPLDFQLAIENMEECRR
ncbi:hypothetical protein [Cupriavidus necator]|uniref:hypothetical protein n=1 Tax=Cupriavidus necator TaxID=106590 RepID=UPI0012D30849|nr:hypothetical protein [Cupriavidus necator]